MGPFLWENVATLVFVAICILPTRTVYCSTTSATCFLELAVRHHKTRVSQHLSTYKHTFCILAATYKEVFGADQNYVYENRLLWRGKQFKEQENAGKSHGATERFLKGTISVYLWTCVFVKSLPSKTLDIIYSTLDSGSILVLRLLRETSRA